MAFFRRMRSPKEPKQDNPIPNRSFSTSVLHSTTNGHRRHKSDEVLNVDYSSSDAFNSHNDSRHENPPLPPRNRPGSYSVGGTQLPKQQYPEEECYVTPADTLRHNVARLNQGDGEGGATPTPGEVKKITMHRMTLSQRTGHSNAHSMGHVIDSSEYSTPWNLIQALAESKKPDGAVAPPKPPSKRRDRSTSRNRVLQSSQGDASDDIIPVMSPTPISGSSDDRSLTSSPSSPIGTADPPSTPTADHPTEGGDYDEPWDKKFKHLHVSTQLSKPHHSKPNRPEEDSEGANDSNANTNRAPTPQDPPPPPPSQPPPPSHPPPPLHSFPLRDADLRPRVNTKGSNRGSPPPGYMRPGRSASDRSRNLSPQPDHDHGRSSGNMKGSEWDSGRSNSPLPPLVQSWSVRDQHRAYPHHHDQPGEYLPPNVRNIPRSGSVNVPIVSRRLPSPPLPDDHHERRANSPPSALINVSIPLNDQP